MKRRITLILVALALAGCEASVSDSRSWDNSTRYFQQQQQHNETTGYLRSIDSSLQRATW